MGSPNTQWSSPFIRQCWVTAGVSLNMAGSGAVVAYTSPLLHQLSLPPDTASWIAAMPGLSLVLGNLLAPPIMSRYGRRVANLTSIVPLVAGWVLLYFSAGVPALLSARFVQGLCMGLCTSLSAPLVGEYTSPGPRGAFLMSISASIALAVLAVHQVGAYLSWRYTALLCATVALLDLLIVLFSPESPSWLAEKGQYEACERAFRWLRGNNEEDELEKLIQASVALREAKASAKTSKTFIVRVKSKIAYCKSTFKKNEFVKPIVIMIHVYLMAQCGGVVALVAFPLDLFQHVLGAGFSDSAPLLLLSLDAHRAVANIVAFYVIQKVNRRTILVVTAGVNILALLGCAAYSFAKVSLYIPAEEYALGVFLIHLHMFSVATGSLPLCFILSGEIFPLEYRGFAGGISVICYSMYLFLTVKTFPALLSALALSGTYVLYAAMMTYSLLVAWLLLPETKGRTLQDIENEFRGRPLSPEELKSVQSLTSWRTHTIDRRFSGSVVV